MILYLGLINVGWAKSSEKLQNPNIISLPLLKSTAHKTSLSVIGWTYSTSIYCGSEVPNVAGAIKAPLVAVEARLKARVTSITSITSIC